MMLKRIAILKELDIVKQRQLEEDAFQSWQKEAKAYETKTNKGLGLFIHDEANGLKPNPNYKRYPKPAPKPIDHFNEE